MIQKICAINTDFDLNDNINKNILTFINISTTFNLVLFTWMLFIRCRREYYFSLPESYCEFKNSTCMREVINYILCIRLSINSKIHNLSTKKFSDQHSECFGIESPSSSSKL